jgi:hypothetical protein
MLRERKKTLDPSQFITTPDSGESATADIPSVEEESIIDNIPGLRSDLIPTERADFTLITFQELGGRWRYKLLWDQGGRYDIWGILCQSILDRGAGKSRKECEERARLTIEYMIAESDNRDNTRRETAYKRTSDIQ